MSGAKHWDWFACNVCTSDKNGGSAARTKRCCRLLLAEMLDRSKLRLEGLKPVYPHAVAANSWLCKQQLAKPFIRSPTFDFAHGCHALKKSITVDLSGPSSCKQKEIFETNGYEMRYTKMDCPRQHNHKSTKCKEHSQPSFNVALRSPWPEQSTQSPIESVTAPKKHWTVTRQSTWDRFCDRNKRAEIRNIEQATRRMQLRERWKTDMELATPIHTYRSLDNFHDQDYGSTYGSDFDNRIVPNNASRSTTMTMSNTFDNNANASSMSTKRRNNLRLPPWIYLLPSRAYDNGANMDANRNPDAAELSHSDRHVRYSDREDRIIYPTNSLHHMVVNNAARGRVFRETII